MCASLISDQEATVHCPGSGPLGSPILAPWFAHRIANHTRLTTQGNLHASQFRI